MPKTVFWLRVSQLAAGAVFSAGLFGEGIAFSERGSESTGLALIFAGVIVFIAPIIFRAKVTRDRMTVGSCLDWRFDVSQGGILGQKSVQERRPSSSLYRY